MLESPEYLKILEFKMQNEFSKNSSVGIISREVVIDPSETIRQTPDKIGGRYSPILMATSGMPKSVGISID